MMKMLLNKKLRMITIVLGVALFLGIGAIVGGKIYTDAQTSNFLKDGYVITANAQAESYTYNFSTGQKYSKNFNGEYDFTDNDGNDVTLSPQSFLFYNDNSFVALTKGVLLNFPDISSNKYINHYTIPALMEVSGGSNGYSIVNNDDTIQLDEVLWKISNTQYIVLSDSLKVDFGKGDVREASGFVEFNYIDEGVVQIITKDNVWQTVSSAAKIVTAKGGIIYLVDQIAEFDSIQILLSKLVIDSDSNIELSPLETKSQIVPEFNITGNDGTSGGSGSSGNNGENGNKASNGYNGNLGSNGDDGNSGSDGDDGTDGEEGTDSTIDSTFTTAIPQVNLVEWEVSATGVTGKYHVTDENDMMSSNLNIVIYEAGTGKEIKVINSDGYTDQFLSYQDIIFKNEDLLKPDTEYRLVVSGSYEMNGVTNDREFLSKVFYTDSLGVLVEKESVSTNTIDIRLSEKNYSAVTSATLYLLTQDQAKEEFNPTDTTKNYNTKIISLNAKEEHEETISFTRLTSNTSYVVRLVVTINGQNYISQQAINVQTLKITPTLAGVPTAIANRASWAFELYGGSVIDPEQAIISYVYDVYNSTGTVVRSLEVTPSKVDTPTYLYIDGSKIIVGEEYTFKVKAIYNDNEKIVELVSASSNSFTMIGSQLPAVSFQKASLPDGEEAITAERIQGRLVVSLNGSKIDTSKLSQRPMTITMTCEGIYEKTIKITDVTQLESYDVNQIVINIDEKGLNQNKIYRFDVQAYVDVGDGYNTNRSIGHVVHATRSLTKLDAVWSDTTNTSNAFSVNLNFASGNVETNLLDSIDSKILTRVIVQIYDGEDETKLIGEKIFNDTDAALNKSSLTSQFITGKTEITEETFGLDPNHLTGTSYAITVTNVYDYTVVTDETKYVNESGKTVSANLSGYVNEYTITAATRTKIVTKTAQVPNLPDYDKLDSQLKATPIYNVDAEKYGQTKNTAISNNAIIGYYLESAYNNSARLARTINIYSFETDKFTGKTSDIYDLDNKKLLGKNDNGNIVENKKIQISEASYTVPKIAIIFGTGNDGTIINGTTVVYSSSMSRGYHYTFACALEYVSDSDKNIIDSVYPYDHPHYQSILSDTEQLSYVLQSTNQDTPSTAPVIYMYPYKETGGTLQMKYMFEDYDETLLQETKVYRTDPTKNNKDYQIFDMKNPFKAGSSAAGCWNDVNVSVPSGVKNLDYYFEWYPYVADADTKVYVKRSCAYDSSTKLNSSTVNEDNVKIKYDYSNLSNNFLDLTLDCSEEIYQRITGIKLTFKSTDNSGKEHKKELMLKITSDSKKVSVSLSNFADVIGHGNITIDSEVFYDTGNQGWYYAQSTNSGSTIFALENIGTQNQFHYLTYNGTTNTNNISSDTKAMGSLYSTNHNFNSNPNQLTASSIENMNPTIKTPITFYSLFSWSTQSITYNLFASSSYLDMIDSTNDANILTTVPKEVQSAKIGSEVTDKITSVVPSVSSGGYDSYTNFVNLSQLNIYGYSAIDGGSDARITIEIWNKSSTKIVSTKVLKFSDYVNASSTDSIFAFKDLEINGLASDTTYVLRVSAMVNGVTKTLLNANSTTNSYWYMTIMTTSKVTISDSKIDIAYVNYFNKYLDVKYSLTQVKGFKVLYSITDENKEILIDSNEVTSTMLPSMYEKEMSDQIPLKMGWLGDKLEYNTKYKLRIQMAQTDDSGNFVFNEDGSQKYIGDDVYISFTIPTPATPIVFDQMWVDTDSSSSTEMSLNMELSVSDVYKTIMTSEGDVTPYYYVRLYKITGGGVEDVTPDDMKEKLTTGTNYSFKKKDIGTDETYQLIFYTAMDMNYDGQADELPSLEKDSIASLTNSEFEASKKQLILYERAIYKTPDSNGITIGEQSLGVSASDNAMIAVTYKNAVNINRIDKVEYSLTDAKGTVVTGVLDNSEEYPIFVYRTGGYYTLNLPDVLKNKGSYNVVLRYYVKNDMDATYKLHSTYSDIYVY